MSYIRWIKDVCAPKIWPEISPPPHSFSFTSPSSLLFIFLLSRLHVFCFVFSLLSLLSLALPRSVLHGSASASSAHSLGSTGSETVTQSSLVIGHGHANQTGRNLQLIRILPPAIIPPPPPHPQPPTKLITFGGLFPLLVFLFWSCIIKGQIPRQNSLASFSITERDGLSYKGLRKHRQASIYLSPHPDREFLGRLISQQHGLLNNLSDTLSHTMTSQFLPLRASAPNKCSPFIGSDSEILFYVQLKRW